MQVLRGHKKMNKKDFKAQYLSKWWQDTSKRIKARDKNTCQMCGCNDKPLSVHHLYYNNGSIKVDDSALITLCEDCHNEQKEYKERLFEILQVLRQELTDYELCIIIQQNTFDYISDARESIFNRNKDVKLYQCIGDDIVDFKLKNLHRWRTKILDKELKEEAIAFYIKTKNRIENGEKYVSREWLEQTSDWFLKNYGMTIEEYMRDNEEEVRAIMNKVSKKGED